jgi:hypothetical protein
MESIMAIAVLNIGLGAAEAGFIWIFLSLCLDKAISVCETIGDHDHEDLATCRRRCP